MRKRNQNDLINMEGWSQPTHPKVTEKRSSKTTVKHWLVFLRLRLTNTKQIRYPAGAVDEAAIIRWNVLQRRPLRERNWLPQWQLSRKRQNVNDLQKTLKMKMMNPPNQYPSGQRKLPL
jgi:hypothetical protein